MPKRLKHRYGFVAISICATLQHIPSGNVLQFATENCHRNDVSFAMKHCDFPQLCVNCLVVQLPECA